jgi:hypothetical protein
MSMTGEITDSPWTGGPFMAGYCLLPPQLNVTRPTADTSHAARLARRRCAVITAQP